MQFFIRKKLNREVECSSISSLSEAASLLENYGRQPINYWFRASKTIASYIDEIAAETSPENRLRFLQKKVEFYERQTSFIYRWWLRLTTPVRERRECLAYFQAKNILIQLENKTITSWKKKQELILEVFTLKEYMNQLNNPFNKILQRVCQYVEGECKKMTHFTTSQTSVSRSLNSVNGKVRKKRELADNPEERLEQFHDKLIEVKKRFQGQFKNFYCALKEFPYPDPLGNKWDILAKFKKSFESIIYQYTYHECVLDKAWKNRVDPNHLKELVLDWKRNIERLYYSQYDVLLQAMIIVPDDPKAQMCHEHLMKKINQVDVAIDLEFKQRQQREKRLTEVERLRQEVSFLRGELLRYTRDSLFWIRIPAQPLISNIALNVDEKPFMSCGGAARRH